jgi:hypothetical protein
MTDDDDRIHALLGKHLLGRASADEIRELRARRDADAAFREAMDAAERSSAHYRHSAAGEDVRLSASDLPDWLRPAELARGLEGWYWRWLFTTVASTAAVLTMLCAAATLLAPHDDPSRIARHVYVLGAMMLAAAAVAAWFARERLIERVASGGAAWERTVAETREQERRFLSASARASMFVGAGLTATALAVAAALPRTEAGLAMLAATVALTFTLRIAKRRFLLRGLSGEGRIWS